MKRTDRASNPSKPPITHLTSDPGGVGEGETAWPRAAPPHVPASGASNDSDEGDSDEGDRRHPVGYKNPPRWTQFKPKHKGHKRRKPAPRRDFFAEVLDQLDQMVPVTENGKRRKMPGLKASAKTMAHDLMRGDAKALAQFLQLIEQRRTSSPGGALSGSAGKPRKNFEQIMDEFAEEMFERAYQMLCEATGTTEVSNDDVYDKVLSLIREKQIIYVDTNFTDITIFMMVASVGRHMNYISGE